MSRSTVTHVFACTSGFRPPRGERDLQQKVAPEHANRSGDVRGSSCGTTTGSASQHQRCRGYATCPETSKSSRGIGSDSVLMGGSPITRDVAGTQYESLQQD